MYIVTWNTPESTLSLISLFQNKLITKLGNKKNLNFSENRVQNRNDNDNQFPFLSNPSFTIVVLK